MAHKRRASFGQGDHGENLRQARAAAVRDADDARSRGHHDAVRMHEDRVVALDRAIRNHEATKADRGPVAVTGPAHFPGHAIPAPPHAGTPSMAKPRLPRNAAENAAQVADLAKVQRAHRLADEAHTATKLAMRSVSPRSHQIAREAHTAARDAFRELGPAHAKRVESHEKLRTYHWQAQNSIKSTPMRMGASNGRTGAHPGNAAFAQGNAAANSAAPARTFKATGRSASAGGRTAAHPGAKTFYAGTREHHYSEMNRHERLARKGSASRSNAADAHHMVQHHENLSLAHTNHVLAMDAKIRGDAVHARRAAGEAARFEGKAAEHLAASKTLMKAARSEAKAQRAHQAGNTAAVQKTLAGRVNHAVFKTTGRSAATGGRTAAHPGSKAFDAGTASHQARAVEAQYREGAKTSRSAINAHRGAAAAHTEAAARARAAGNGAAAMEHRAQAAAHTETARRLGSPTYTRRGNSAPTGGRTATHPGNQAFAAGHAAAAARTPAGPTIMAARTPTKARSPIAQARSASDAAYRASAHAKATGTAEAHEAARLAHNEAALLHGRVGGAAGMRERTVHLGIGERHAAAAAKPAAPARTLRATGRTAAAGGRTAGHPGNAAFAVGTGLHQNRERLKQTYSSPQSLRLQAEAAHRRELSHIHPSRLPQAAAQARVLKLGAGRAPMGGRTAAHPGNATFARGSVAHAMAPGHVRRNGVLPNDAASVAARLQKAGVRSGLKIAHDSPAALAKHAAPSHHQIANPVAHIQDRLGAKRKAHSGLAVAKQMHALALKKGDHEAAARHLTAANAYQHALNMHKLGAHAGARLKAAPGMAQTGKRGGRFVLTAGGHKRYLKK